MKKLMKVEEIEGDGLIGLLGERITLYCLNYIYTGKLEGVNDKFVKLVDAAIVYDTGDFKKKDWACAEPLPGEWFIATPSIESYGKLK